jgi:hypothetical protein
MSGFDIGLAKRSEGHVKATQVEALIELNRRRPLVFMAESLTKI